MPLEENEAGALVQDSVELYTEVDFPILVPRGLVVATLYSDGILLKNSDVDMTIPMEDIHYVSIDRNAKLQLTLPAQMIQLRFGEKGSALQWQETIGRLKADAETTTAANTTAPR